MLSREAARAFYDQFGVKQDDQGHYEDPPLQHLIAECALGEASAVCEFGCGTGRFAANLLANHLPASATYIGYDLSATMIGLATERLTPFADRVELHQTDGDPRLPLPDASVDRFISTYVLDLLTTCDIRTVIDEAHRLLRPNGLLGVVGLTTGVTPLSRVISSLWTLIHRIRARTVGGCRPLQLLHQIDTDAWILVHRHVLVAASIPSEVVVLEKA